ncbi:hypothetical protein [Blastomonas sp.]|uniref:hypothetical protein n=1 Tax=Blastomonas sp. TaxID=1909299 RepID=UPI0035944888
MHLPYIGSREAYDDACILLSRYGDAAGLEASERAEAARNVGNHIHFCHWRQIERLLVIMTIDQSIGTIH